LLRTPITSCGGEQIWENLDTEAKEKSSIRQGKRTAGKWNREMGRAKARSTRKLLAIEKSRSESRGSGGSFFLLTRFMVVEGGNWPRELGSL